MSNYSESDDSPVVYKSPQTTSSTSHHDQQSYPQHPGRPQYQPQYSNPSQSYPQSYYQQSNQPQYQQPPSGNYPASYPQQHQGQYPAQYPPQGQYPGQYQGQYQGNNPQQYQGSHPGQYQNYQQEPMNMSYGQAPTERGIFANLFDGAFSSIMGCGIIYPFIQARRMLSIRPDTPAPERAQRYMYALPQFIRQRGPASLWDGFRTYVAKAPALTLDLVFFNLLKKIAYPESSVAPWIVPWLSTVILAGSGAGLTHLVYHPVTDAFNRLQHTPENFREMLNEVKGSIKNKYQVTGFKGLYRGTGASLPVFLIYRGIQLGSIDSGLQTIKYNEGHTSLFRKFLICFSFTIIARFLVYPLQIAKEAGPIEEGSFSKNFKKFTQRATGVFKEGAMTVLRKAYSRSFQASSSAMTFALFYHFGDDAQRRR